MNGYQKHLDFLFFILTAFIFSSTLILGAIVAPVVFHSGEFISSVSLSRFENGQLMSEIFRRFSIVLNIAVLIIIIYEALNYKKFLQSGFYMIAFAVLIVSALLFSFYFTPIILGLLGSGTQVINQNITAFETLHKASEIDFSVLMFSSFAMFALKYYRR